jgi:activating signal cointegrator complex subunit 1
MTLRDEMLSRAVELLRDLRLSVELARAIAASSSAAVDAAAVAPATNEESGAADAPRHLRVTLAGLDAMRDPSQTSVLYAPPHDPRGELLRFCETVRKPFLESGLMADEGRPLLLHATVVNTIYARRGGSGNHQRGRGRRKPVMLDARDVLARYEGHVWMEDEVVDKVTLCRMGAKEVEGSGGDAAYAVEAEVSF